MDRFREDSGGGDVSFNLPESPLKQTEQLGWQIKDLLIKHSHKPPKYKQWQPSD